MFRQGIVTFFDEGLEQGFIELKTDHQRIIFTLEDFSNATVLPQIGERVKCVVVDVDGQPFAKFIVRLDHKNYVDVKTSKITSLGGDHATESVRSLRKILKKRRVHEEEEQVANPAESQIEEPLETTPEPSTLKIPKVSKIKVQTVKEQTVSSSTQQKLTQKKSSAKKTAKKQVNIQNSEVESSENSGISLQEQTVSVDKVSSSNIAPKLVDARIEQALVNLYIPHVPMQTKSIVDTSHSPDIRSEDTESTQEDLSSVSMKNVAPVVSLSSQYDVPKAPLFTQVAKVKVKHKTDLQDQTYVKQNSEFTAAVVNEISAVPFESAEVNKNAQVTENVKADVEEQQVPLIVEPEIQVHEQSLPQSVDHQANNVATLQVDVLEEPQVEFLKVEKPPVEIAKISNPKIEQVIESNEVLKAEVPVLDLVHETKSRHNEQVKEDKVDSYLQSQLDQKFIEQRMYPSAFQKILHNFKVKFLYSKHKKPVKPVVAKTSVSFNPVFFIMFASLLLSVCVVFYAMDYYKNYKGENALKLQQYQKEQQELNKEQKREAQRH